MNYLLVIPRTIWKLIFLTNFVLGLLILYPFFLILLSNRKTFPLAFRLKRFWAAWILTLPGLFINLKRKTKQELPHPAIYCGNHASYLDIVASYRITNKYFVFMGKQELSKAPLFNIFFKEMNILVDRSSNIGSHRAFLQAGEEITRGNSVFLYPEGTISSVGKLRPFKNGAFRLAIEKQIPVIPVTYLNNWKLLQNGGFFKSPGRPGISRIVIHEPISTVGMDEKNVLTLKEQVRSVILAELEKYNSSK
jgi:1-acyl-sn-glycerol-3-phosphate acyltransferase